MGNNIRNVLPLTLLDKSKKYCTIVIRALGHTLHSYYHLGYGVDVEHT